ncbi:unnamed protein product [Allacma fusca]|uniref:GPN-loop GTPase n=1 Tax=Allacma fusca TaxID=39272 RepID=A0A8J2LR96_9HEXA|nr:unnamed protein product [Allacma fusca]
MAQSVQPEDLAIQMTALKIVEKPTENVPVSGILDPVNELSTAEAPGEINVPSSEQPDQIPEQPMDTDSTTNTSEYLPTVLIMMGMAGSGKTTLTSALISHIYTTGTAPYVVNLDPACNDPPYGVNIDIRDTINYKQIMHGNKLGPNGAIVTSLNLFSTKFDTVLEILKNRGKHCKYILIDTPGQIEVFMWSASGSIITEILAANFPTIMVYVTDLVGTQSPIAFMSNMTYACSVLYKTKLPLVLALNKCDVQNADKIKSWITDFNSFHLELNNYKGQSVNLASSLSLVLDDFYSNIQHVAISALTSIGMSDLFKAVGKAVEEYKTVYRVNYEKLRKERKRELTMPKGKSKKESTDDFAFSVPANSAGGTGLTLTLDDDSDELESEEEDPKLLEEDEGELDFETISQVYKRELERRRQQPGPSTSS